MSTNDRSPKEKEMDFSPLLKTMIAMNQVKTKGKEAKENEYSMTDSKGNKILYFLTDRMVKNSKFVRWSITKANNEFYIEFKPQTNTPKLDDILKVKRTFNTMAMAQEFVDMVIWKFSKDFNGSLDSWIDAKLFLEEIINLDIRGFIKEYEENTKIKVEHQFPFKDLLKK